jgi:NAD(P)-dependent dehydrogenase (short-subunit alcohol dehydrogenase family)
MTGVLADKVLLVTGGASGIGLATAVLAARSGAAGAAVLTLSKVAAKEAGPRGVRVNALCPGLTDTPMLRESLGTRALTSGIVERIALGRVGTPAEIAEAAVWLCSDRSSFATGVGLVVDGGRTG